MDEKETVIFDSEGAADAPDYLLETIPNTPKNPVTPPLGTEPGIKETDKKAKALARLEHRKRLDRERQKRHENTKKRVAKKLLFGIENGDTVFGLVERTFLGALIITIEKGNWQLSLLLACLMAGTWFAKLKLGEGSLIKSIRDTDKHTLENVLVKIATTIKS